MAKNRRGRRGSPRRVPPPNPSSDGTVPIEHPRQLVPDLELEFPADIQDCLPDDPIQRDKLFLTFGVSLLLEKLPADIPAFREEFGAHTAGEEGPGFTEVLSSIVEKNCGTQLARLFPQWDPSSRSEWVARWFGMSLQPHCFREAKVADSRTGVSIPMLLAGGLVGAMNQAYGRATES